jgi:PDZ domain-containing secreted protein
LGGWRPGIVAVDGITLRTEKQLIGILSRHKVGDVVAIAIARDDRAMIVKVQLTTPP